MFGTKVVEKIQTCLHVQ